MKFITGFSVVLLVFQVFTQVTKRSKPWCGLSWKAHGNVVGGKPTVKHSFPWLVAFRLIPENIFFCGGSLVSDKHIVSAAHCFLNKEIYQKERLKLSHEVLALLGKHDLNKENESGSVTHNVSRIMLHEDWNYKHPSFDADLALIVLEIKVDLTNPSVKLVCLPKASNLAFSGTGRVIGWGISERSIADREFHDSKPNEIELPAVTREQCLAASAELDSISSIRTFCAGFVNQKKSACKGDSGGGFYVYDTVRRAFILNGIVSASLYDFDGICSSENYSIFTDVSKFVDWIEEKIEKTKEYTRISEKECTSYMERLVPKQITGYCSEGQSSEDCKSENLTITCKHRSSGLIVGGVDASPGEFPHMAALGWRKENGKIKFYCGGSLISEKFVLTIARCGDAPSVVRLGEHNILTTNDGANPVDYEIEEIIIHPNYQKKRRENDIALIKIVRTVTFNDNIRPACLKQTNDIKSRVIATGWGKNEASRSQTNKLQKVSLKVISNPLCQDEYDKLSITITPSQICAGGSGKGTCQGDTGGPIQALRTDSYCMFEIYGLTSYGLSCKNSMPAVYTRVYSYLDWIESIVWP